MGSEAAMEGGPDGADEFGASLGDPVAGVYRWLPDLGVALLAEQTQAEALASTLAVMRIVVVSTLGALVFAVGIALLTTRGIVRPLAHLTEAATRIAAGDLTLVAPVEQKDEIGALAQAFNSMTAQMRELIDSLEQRVAERTRELERRSAYLEASAEVGRAASSILDPDALVREAVELIRERFGLYYVGLFLLDEAGEWAVLQAGTGEAGRAMLSRRHRIQVGQGMVGWVVANAQWRVASEVGQDAVRLATPELPYTRSEAALPLHSRDQVIGALTVQDTHPDTFSDETMVVLQTMADQIAVALDNARLFVESQEALESERRAYGEISREAWAQMIPRGIALGYRCDQRGVSLTENNLPSEAKQSVREGQVVRVEDGGRPAVAVPIPVRDQVIGVLNFRKGGRGDTWTDAEISLLQGLAEELGQALESARLYQETQRRAAREQVFSEVTSRIRETLDMESVLRTAAQEVQQALGLPEVVIRLAGAPEDDAQESEEQSRP
jgi:GAF domain-containing protein/HAMP domain-containing protein